MEAFNIWVHRERRATSRLSPIHIYSPNYAGLNEGLTVVQLVMKVGMMVELSSSTLVVKLNANLSARGSRAARGCESSALVFTPLSGLRVDS